ncbi:SDR family NAD(P)-dependent oxidoreductase [Vibrio fluvialis]|nr:SDR family oxidoreductase [Vibrio fluvialis]EKO3999692.1 SDR family NAD(P)-dependent oxidoreductase [Vibrio fluvialis]
MKALLQGKTAIITGGSGGIGRATAELFLAEGANVVITARRQQKLDEAVQALSASGGKVIGVVADSADRDAPKRVFEQAIDAFGKVEILVNNAGIADLCSIEETTDELLEQVVNVNYLGVFRFCREAVQHFMPHNAGIIVNVSSVNADLPVCGPAYTSTKGAVNNLTQNIAIRFAGTGIRCNAVAPGATDTELARAYFDGNMLGGCSGMAKYGALYSNLDLPATQAEDQANAILYLASNMSRAVTGRVLTVDNGINF